MMVEQNEMRNVKRNIDLLRNEFTSNETTGIDIIVVLEGRTSTLAQTRTNILQNNNIDHSNNNNNTQSDHNMTSNSDDDDNRSNTKLTPPNENSSNEGIVIIVDTIMIQQVDMLTGMMMHLRPLLVDVHHSFRMRKRLRN